MFRHRTSINYCPLSDTYSDDISHPLIISTYNNLLSNYLYILKECLYVSIRVSNGNVWINFISKNKIDFLLELIYDSKYTIYNNNLFICGNPYVHEHFIIDDISIQQYQKPYSFFQVYEYIRLDIYKYIKNSFLDTIDNLLCIGGEFYMYSQILKYKSLETYTDCNDLYNDALYNNPNFPVTLIDYTKDTINIDKNNNTHSVLIINVSRNGLKKKLKDNIIHWKGDIIYVGCKKNIVDNDILYFKKETIHYKNYDNNVFLVHLK